MNTNEEFKHTEISSQNQLLYKVLNAGVKVDRFSFKKLCRDFGVIECERLAARINDVKQRLAEDEMIGELITDDIGQYRMVNGKKIYQIEEKTQDDIDKNLVINRARASGMRGAELLRMMIRGL